MSGCRSEAGRLFQILGPATEKLLSSSRVFGLGTYNYYNYRYHYYYYNIYSQAVTA